MKLSVLDQSPIINGHTAAQAIAETIRLARFAEELGFHRYWLAEHHAIAALADPCPEILAARVLSATTRIRVGTGGVLLPYYSPFKVAEQFRMLEALFPGRVDLGIGRAPGGDRTTAMALGEGRYPAAENFPDQVQYLVAYLDGTLPADHPFARVAVQPVGDTAPQVWLLGSSDYSGALAAELGLRFAFANFISASSGDVVMRDYRRNFKASTRETQPHCALAVAVICADTDAEADRLAASLDQRRLDMDYGLNLPVPDEAQAQARSYTQTERARIDHNRARAVLGAPATVRAKLAELQAASEADELVVVTITGSYGARMRSYELLAQACFSGAAEPVPVR